MAQTAVKASVLDNLFVYNPKSFLSNDNTRAEQVVDDLKSSFDLISSTNAFFYNSRIRLTFQVRATTSEFVLLKGLLEFYRGGNYAFIYRKDEKSIEVDIRESELDAFKGFLATTFALLHEELSFKTKLKRLIDFESKYKTEQKALYAAIIK